MFAKCACCQSRILAGGESFLHWQLCGEGCAHRFRASLVDEVVPPELVEQQIRQVFEATCPLCGRESTNDLYSATKITAFLIMFQMETQKHICCAGCARKKRMFAALHCFVAGWWGPKAALFNLFVLPTNLIAAAFIKSPTEPSPALMTMIKSSMAESMSPHIMTAIQASADPDLDKFD